MEMIIREADREEKVSKAVLKYRIIKNQKGKEEWKAVYLKETPKEEIERLNNMFKVN